MEALHSQKKKKKKNHKYTKWDFSFLSILATKMKIKVVKYKLLADVWYITSMLSWYLILLNMLNWILKGAFWRFHNNTYLDRVGHNNYQRVLPCLTIQGRSWNLIWDLETAVGGCFQPIQNQAQGWVGGCRVVQRKRHKHRRLWWK